MYQNISLHDAAMLKVQLVVFIMYDIRLMHGDQYHSTFEI